MIPFRYFVVKCKSLWRVEFENTYKNGFQNKKSAIQYAIEEAQKKAQGGIRCEVLVQDEDKLWYTAWYSPEENQPRDISLFNDNKHVRKERLS